VHTRKEKKWRIISPRNRFPAAVWRRCCSSDDEDEDDRQLDENDDVEVGLLSPRNVPMKRLWKSVGCGGDQEDDKTWHAGSNSGKRE
jgi:hypothetical protein